MADNLRCHALRIYDEPFAWARNPCANNFLLRASVRFQMCHWVNLVFGLKFLTRIGKNPMKASSDASLLKLCM
jgi:hypothetical protein